MPESAPARTGPGRRAAHYTDEEIRILLQGVADGLNDGAIGRLLSPQFPRSHDAVKSMRHRISRRWKAVNPAHLVSLAYQRGILTVDTPRGTVEALRAGAVRPAPANRAPRPPGHTTTRGSSG